MKSPANMAATVGSIGWNKATGTQKNDSLPQLSNMASASPHQQVDPSLKQQLYLKRVPPQGNMNLQSAEFGHLTRSESGVAIGQQYNRSDIASGKSAFRTPDKVTHGILGKKLFEHPNLYPTPHNDGLQPENHNHGRSITQSTPYSPILKKGDFNQLQKKQKSSMETEVQPSLHSNIFMTTQRPLGKAGQQSPSRQLATRSGFFVEKSRQNQQHLNTFFVNSKKLDIEQTPRSNKRKILSCVTQPDDNNKNPQSGVQKGHRRVNSCCYDQSDSEFGPQLQVDTRQYLMQIAQPNQPTAQLSSPSRQKQFPLIKQNQQQDTASQLSLIAKSVQDARTKYSVHQKNRRMNTIRSPETMHSALKQHQQEHKSVLALPISAVNNQSLEDSFNNEIRQSRYDALQVIQNLIFETSCNPNQMHSTKAIQQAQIYQFLAAKESFFNTNSQSKPQTSYTPNETPNKRERGGLFSNNQTQRKDDVNIKMIPIDLPKPTPNQVEMMFPRKSNFQSLSRTPKPTLAGNNVNLNQYMK